MDFTKEEVEFIKYCILNVQGMLEYCARGVSKDDKETFDNIEKAKRLVEKINKNQIS